jgi:hypothetical protein
MLDSDMRDSLYSPHHAGVRQAERAARRPTKSIGQMYRHRTAFPGVVCPVYERSSARDVRDALVRMSRDSSYLKLDSESSVTLPMRTSSSAAHTFTAHAVPRDPPRTLKSRKPSSARLPYGSDSVLGNPLTTQYRAELCRDPYHKDHYCVLPRDPVDPSVALYDSATAASARKCVEAAVPLVHVPTRPATASRTRSGVDASLLRSELGGVRMAGAREAVRLRDRERAAAEREEEQLQRIAEMRLSIRTLSIENSRRQQERP